MSGSAALFFFLSAAFALVCGCAEGGRDQKIDLPNKAVTKKVLDNGLTILARKSPPDGLVAIDVKILAGSGAEGEYLGSGISHLVEHMLFKGTAARPVGAIEREIKSYGGLINGSTSPDITDYHIIIPSQYLPQALAILRDMLANAAFDDAEFAKEKEVVVKEIKLNEDEPQSRLIKRLNETAFLRHPYRYPTIGYEARFRASSRADALKFYNKMYVPNRMVLTIVGGVDEADAIAKAEAEFRDFRPPDYGVVDITETEPAQLGTRSLDEDSRVNLAYLALGFHSTSLLDKDLFAMDVLAMILGRGDNSRLYDSLVKKGRLAYTITAWNLTPRDPGLFVIDAVLGKENVSKAETAIREEVAKLREGNISDAELRGARRMVLSDFIRSLQTVDAQANDIGLNQILSGSPDFSARYVEGIQAVTKDDVKRVANKYLSWPNLTVVRLIPASGKTKTPGAATPKVSDTIRKETLPNGLRVLVRRDPNTPTVSIMAAMLGGIMVENDTNNGISNLTAGMMLKGTKTRDESKIKGYIDRLGGNIDTLTGFSSFGIRIDILKPDLRSALDILKDVLADPEFPQTELDKEKELVIAAIREEDDDIFATGINALRRAVFANSPYGLRYLGTEAAILALKRADLMAFWKRFCVSDNMVIAISGDVDPDGVIATVRSGFSGLAPGRASIAVPGGARLTKPETKTIRMRKEQSLVLLGFETTSVKDPDRYPLEVLSSVLSGYSGRLFTELRSRNPLAYSLGCVQKVSLGKGFFALYIATAKGDVESVKMSLLEEVERVRRGDVTGEEITLAKRELRAGRQVAMQTNDFFAFNSAIDELYGLGYDDLYRYEAAIEKVTKDDIERVARKYFDPDSYAAVVITP